MDFVWRVDANKLCAIVSCDLQRRLPITKWTVAVLLGVSADGQYQKQQRFAATTALELLISGRLL